MSARERIAAQLAEVQSERESKSSFGRGMHSGEIIGLTLALNIIDSEDEH